MNCGKCKFAVNQDMKFALMKNICPACGSQLFSDNEMRDISLLRNRLGKQSFSIDFSEELAFDIALFVMNEIKNGIGQKYFQKMMTNSGPPISAEEGEEETDAEAKARMRAQVAREYEELQEMPEETITVRTRAESANEKAKRLRDIARKAGVGSKSGAMVRRAGS
jgi:hypothetical protein